MDTRVATAELGWTAYPNSGVSQLCAMQKQKWSNNNLIKKNRPKVESLALETSCCVVRVL